MRNGTYVVKSPLAQITGETMADTNGKKTLIPYVPFKTFTNTLDSLAGEMMPARIDTSIWNNYSGATRSQLMGTFKFFGLLNEDNSPTADFKKLADDKEGRPALLREIMKRSYGDLMRMDLSKATPKTFDEALRKYGQEGETHRKAMAFFMSAAKLAGVHLSPLLTKRGNMAAMRPKKVTPVKERLANTFEVPDGGRTVYREQEGPAKVVTLEGGATLTLSTSVDAFRLPSSDRKFVFELLDLIEKYESAHPVEGAEDEE
jgi:hypothetical protein